MDVTEIKVLFLAHYAPKSKNECIPSNIKDISYAVYHHKVFQELSLIFPNLISTNDISIIFQTALDIDYIFSLYNRIPFRNSEIFVSSVAEYLKIPYLGAPPNIRALAEDKHIAKMLAMYLGIPTPEWKIYNQGDNLLPPNFSPPYFIKPRFGAASIYIDENASCFSWNAAKERIGFLFNQGIDVILEKQIYGIYHTSPVLNNFGQPLFLPCIRQVSSNKNGIVTYEQKRKIVSGLERFVVLDNNLNHQIQNYSKKMFDQIQPIDYTRFDYIVDDMGIPYFLEFNVCCNLGEHSTINQSAGSLGISYKQLIENITYSSLFRHNLIQESFGKHF